MTNVKYLREQTKGSKHVTFDPSDRFVAVSCTDGVLYIYSLVEDEPELVRKLDGVIRRLEPEDEATSRAVWHPDGTAFAAAQASRDVAIFSTSDWNKQKSFQSGHLGDITALNWSPNGAMLATAAADGTILLWETGSQTIIRRYEFANVINLAWHPTNNLLSFTTSDGELFIHENFVPRQYKDLLEKPLQSAPVHSSALAEKSANIQKPITTSRPKPVSTDRRRDDSPDSLDDILGPMDEDDDFVEDDDGAGYAEGLNAYGKRTNGHLDDPDEPGRKRFAPFWQPDTHEPFQPGSTPWRGNRRYLCKSLG